MTFEEMIKKTPMMNTSKAIQIITDLTLTQYGILNSENMYKANKRTSENISDLMLSCDNVTKQYFTIDPYDQFSKSTEISYEYYCILDEKETYGLVNFNELLTEYNDCRIQDGFGPIHISLKENRSDTSAPSTSPSALVDFATSICQIVTNITPRDDLIKAETLDAIIDEGLSKITDESIKTALHKIKIELRNILKGKITKGRLKKVADKKIESAIHLADTYKDAASDTDKVKKYRKEIAGFDLSVSDRNHVIAVFNEYRNTTKQM